MNDISLYEKMPLRENNLPIYMYLQDINSSILFTHWHEHIEIIYILSGKCRMTCATNTFTAKGGDLVFVNSNEIHFFDSADNIKYIYLIINPELINDVQIENHIKVDERIKELFDELYSQYSKNDMTYENSIKALTYELIAYLLRKYPKDKDNSTLTKENIMAMNRIKEIVSYISLNYSEKITTKELSKKWYLSEYYFCRFFKQYMGQTPVNYINRMRIEKAKILLDNTNESITNIAIKVGFDDVNYFSRTFKKFACLTPTQYKNR